MKKKTFNLSVFAVALIIIAILFSACSIGNTDPNKNTTDPNESVSTSTTEPITNESESNPKSNLPPKVTYSYYQTFVASANDENCTPGYLYFHEDWDSERKLLLAKMLKICGDAEFKNSVYVITEENEVIEVNKTDGSYETIYKAKYGDIDFISIVVCVNRYVYFNDGNYIIELDPISNECKEKLKTDKKICSIQAGGDAIKENEYNVYCDICGPDGEYFTYIVGSEEEGYESYWHHPETGEDELIDINCVSTYGGNWLDSYYYTFKWKVEK